MAVVNKAEPSTRGRATSTRFGAIWRRFHVGAILAHVGLSALFTWPLVLNFLPGSTGMTPGTLIVDRDQNLWNLWWVGHALGSGHNPFVTDFIWNPTPVSLYYHTLNLFNGLLAFPLLGFLPLTTIYNLIVLFSFVVGGYGAFLLVHYLCGNRWAGLVGSVVFAYSAYHIATMRGLLQLISLEWFPFFVLFLLRAVYAPYWTSRRDSALWTIRRALPAAFALLLVSLVDWYYTMYGLMLAGLLMLYVPVRQLWERMSAASSEADAGQARPSAWRRVGEQWTRIAICLGIYGALASPILAPTVGELRTNSYMVPAQGESLANSADLLAFFQPPRDQRLWGQFFTNRQRWPFASNTYEVYLTYTALLLAGAALFRTRRLRPLAPDRGGPAEATKTWSESLPGKWFWVACGITFFLLALGPVLQVNGQQIGWMPMPYGLVEHLPVLNISRSPDRFDMPLTLCLGVLAGYGTNVLAGAGGAAASQKRRRIIALGAVALIVVELAPMPYVQSVAATPRWYSQLGQEAGDFSILELPPQDDYWHGAFRMYSQTAHGKRIFGGYISREFPHPFLLSTPGYRELTSTEEVADMFADGPQEWYSAFALYDTRYIVLQKVRLPEISEELVDVSHSREAISRLLGEDRPVYEDEQLAAYKVPSIPERVPFLSLGNGWEPRESGPNGAFRWMHGTATLRIDSPRRMDTYLSFRATALGPARILRILHGSTEIFNGEVGALAPLRIGPLGLPQGISTITFISPTGTTSPASLGQGTDRRQLSFALLDVKLEIQP